ncbi:hypothetical protein A3C23_03115 [Candidatus Roizmanbacteria bacterium RIFCSPHIGHO2_02_FULL_37_13b]|uniref:Uncharacterized protein n=1 Tax=Candidatus Roizmanbacteria bacterium RIFCSPLOWO2_02_FULL_36_11 TaxID=1802071 RepID=A0A1F7JIC0_9BACT|nr:MAG: hypothetical protein A3C23_03115 [Candidatus Roizmanbacteria bacterium RIFCSPHIGHO2_02_FULL_37_13b]OGK55341.1 MAG: hypothetical protein A3H78_04550 [Candidatus Roizmanbacteria bacterium RIFCSPLOWO2_02_FULL_36_11]
MKQRELLIISLTVFLTLIAWIVADINHVINTQKVDAARPEYLKPINVNIDIDVFEKIINKK